MCPDFHADRIQAIGKSVKVHASVDLRTTFEADVVSDRNRGEYFSFR